MAILALAEGALCAMLYPGGSSEANDVGFIQTRFGDVVANGVGLAGVGDTAGAALVLGEHTELTVHLRARQGPAVNLSLQTAALLTVLYPGITTVIGKLPTLM